MDTAHDVMSGRPDFHRLFGDVDVRQLFELVIHAWQFSLNVISGVGELLFDPGDIEINAAVRAPPSLFDFPDNAAGDVISRQ